MTIADAALDRSSDARNDVITPDADGGRDTGPADSGAPGPLPEEVTGAVVEYHGSPARAGFYGDVALTATARRTLHRDTAFAPNFAGSVTGQPLYVPNGPGGKAVYVVATNENHVLALDATTGSAIWDKAFGTPVPRSALPCGNIDPMGIVGTPFVDATARTIYFDAMSTPDGTTPGHHIFAIGLDDGATRSGWPVDVEAKVPGFSSAAQGQRGGLTVQNGVLYVPFGGHYGDCDPYHGHVVGVPIATPGMGVKSWQTTASRGGIWAVGGVLADRNSIFAATGNTADAATWTGGEAVLRFSAGPVFSGSPADYFRPMNWVMLDDSDLDLGGATPVLVDVPGATPSRLIVALGKDSNVYILNRDNLGGEAGQVSMSAVATSEVTGSLTAYRTNNGTYVGFRVQRGGGGLNCAEPGNVVAIKISASSPPKATLAWCSREQGLGTPMATTVDHGKSAVVWAVGSNLVGYDGDTGEEVFKSTDSLEGVDHFATPIDVPGGIVVAGKTLYVYRP
jgi:hypothetical protein